MALTTVIKAFIVQVMKDKKRMTHYRLVSEVTLQLTSRFLPDHMDIKKRIKALIEVGGAAKSPV